MKPASFVAILLRLFVINTFTATLIYGIAAAYAFQAQAKFIKNFNPEGNAGAPAHPAGAPFATLFEFQSVMCISILLLAVLL